jgi:hypothetical protein
MKRKTTTITESSARALLTKKKSEFTYRQVKDEDIDYSDIPELTQEQMRQFKPRFAKSKSKSK